MRIVFDCRSVFPGMGGIGRTTAALARHLPQALPEAELVYLFGDRRPELPFVEAPNVEELVTEAAMIDPIFEQLQLPAVLDEVEADVYHNPCFSLPVVAAPHTIRVATVHDVVFRRRPDLVPEWLRSYLDSSTRASSQLADAIVTVSAFSAKELRALYEVSAQIAVVPNAVDAKFHAPPSAASPTAKPYVLYVGAIEAKKNVRALLDGMAELLAQRPDLPHSLLLVGSVQSGFDLNRAIEDSGIPQDRVHYLGHVQEAALPELYQNAEVLCYLSEYEGFGLPALEAMASGTPVVAADLSCLPEVTDGAALLVDPHEPDLVAEAIATLIDDVELRAELTAHGRQVATRWSWADAADQLGRLYHDLWAERRLGVAS